MTGTYFQEVGLKRHIVGNQRFELHDDDLIGWVESGHLDIFVSRLDNHAKLIGRQRFVTSIGENEFFFCNQNLCRETGFLAKAAEDTVIYTLRSADIIDSQIAVMGSLLDRWAEAIGRFIGPHINCKADVYLKQTARQVELEAQHPLRLTATSRTLLWFAPPDGLQDVLIPEHFPVTFEDHFPIPLCQYFVLEVTSTRNETVKLYSSAELVKKYGLQTTLKAMSKFSTLHCQKRLEKLTQEISKYSHYQENSDVKKWHKSVGYLANLIDPSADDSVSAAPGHDHLLVTFERVVKGLGVDFVPPEILEYQSDEPPSP